MKITSDKFKIGISGHRDIKYKDRDTYLYKIKKHLNYFIDKYPRKEILAVSPLADGSDRLFIQAAIEIGLRYEVILPMKPNLYEKDFDDNSYREFNKMLLNARMYKVIPLYNNVSEQAITYYGKDRNLQYREVGYQIIRETDFMLFLWDGKKSTKVGGTFDILNFAKNNNVKYQIIYCDRESYG
jgi:hypothetical protein